MYAVVYRWAMGTFENEAVPIYKAVQVVIEALTTAGFGGHAPWSSVQLNFLMLAMNVTGVLLMFLALPIFAVPMLRQAVQSGPPQSSDLSDHVIICSYTARDDVLRKELEEVDVPYVIVDEDPNVVTDLREQEINAIQGDPERVATLRAANAPEAQALVADVDDETNPTVILSAARVNPDLQIVSVVRDHADAPYHRYAGADEVVQARQQLGEALAIRSMRSFSEKLRQVIDVDTDLEITELLVEETSPLVGRTIENASIFDRTGITILGVWVGGKFVVSPDPAMRIEENTILLAAGNHSALEQVEARPLPPHNDDCTRVVVAGYGATGRAVVKALRDEGIDVTTIDLEAQEGVDVVGNVNDPETLAEADIENARAVVLTMDEDSPTIYSSLMIKETAPETEIIARADRSENVWKLYNAGADFVLSLPTVTGEILASLLADSTEILTPQTEFVRTETPAIVGRSLHEVDLRRETGCTVVAAERGDELVTEIGAEFTVEEGDILIAAGSEEATKKFLEFVGERDHEREASPEVY
ncbi:potassium channel family protein [Halalkalicoccus tibetensis]|uniref:Potassium channel family protein n=1 Tax=Halalkalicoccus tibetensis TaxID=175632 RepID=A0ABD5V8W6_9EURY